MSHRRSAALATAASAVAIAAGVLAGCSSPTGPSADPSSARPAPSAAHSPSTPAGPSSSTSSSGGSATSPVASTSSAASSTSASGPQLPLGGRVILGHYRVVAFYGAPGGDQLGVLGARPPAQEAPYIERQAAAYDGYGRTVQPAMELITWVARASPGPDGSYSSEIPTSQVKQYLAVAHRDHMLLILDVQPGRASFLSEVKPLRHLLEDPSVELGLDPEWSVGPGQRPGDGLIGSTTASAVNAVIGYVHGIVQRYDLPDKLVIVHQFTDSMVRDRSAIAPQPGVEVVFHADGFGSRAVKKGVFHRLDFPGPPFGVGFKLFYRQDIRLLSPADVMRLRPRPDVITYE